MVTLLCSSTSSARQLAHDDWPNANAHRLWRTDRTERGIDSTLDVIDVLRLLWHCQVIRVLLMTRIKRLRLPNNPRMTKYLSCRWALRWHYVHHMTDEIFRFNRHCRPSLREKGKVLEFMQSSIQGFNLRHSQDPTRPILCASEWFPARRWACWQMAFVR